MRASSIIPLLLAALVTSSQAWSVSCHCFKERQFNPAAPDAADPYIVATTRNTLFALVYGLEKKSIVRDRMTGTTEEDLWLAYWVGEKTGLDTKYLSAAKHSSDGWPTALKKLSPAHLAKLPEGFIKSLEGGAGSNELASIAADEVLVRVLGSDLATLERLASSGADISQRVIAVFLGARSGVAPVKLFEEVSAGSTSWGRVMHDFSIEPKGIINELRRLISSKP